MSHSLRSAKGATQSRESSIQTTIEFRKRKRGGRTLKGEMDSNQDTRVVNENLPPKKAKSSVEPGKQASKLPRLDYPLMYLPYHYTMFSSVSL